MARALELAANGCGHVEPNPMVGCLVARGAEIVGEGWHSRFGGPHAEVEALAVAGDRAAQSTIYLTLEPCCHQGKTPPCTDAVIAAGVRRAVIALRDPFPEVSGRGIAQLEAAGIEVVVGVLQQQARRLNAPYLKLLESGRPWIIAKWAMTLDGKIATRTGDSKWISCEASRRIAHELRGRVDAIVVGSGTARADDPLLTARPPGARAAARIVLDSRGSLSSESQLVQTAREVPVLVAAGPEAAESEQKRLRDTGCEVLVLDARDREERLEQLLDELGRRRMTNVMVEGGGEVLGSLFDAGHVDEVHVFIAPKLLGGRDAPSPIAGRGFDSITAALSLEEFQWQQVGDDLYIHGRVKR